MSYNDVGFDISTNVLALGLRGAYLAMGNLCNRDSDPEFEDIKRQTINKVRANLSLDKIKQHPVLRGFRQLHEAVGCSNRKNIASPENLLLLVLKTGALPHVNLLVDIYNLVSIKTGLALGAHDLAKVSGNIHLRLTNGTEGFQPLGSAELRAIGSGEYGYIDDNNDVICRLEVRQVEKTKVGLDTTECFYIVQGNSATDNKMIRSAVEELVTLTKKFCGGDERFLYEPRQTDSVS